jgi:hypothetical protein
MIEGADDRGRVQVDCETQPTESLIHLFVGLVQQGRIKRGQRPAERPVFRKLHGVAHAHLEMLPNAPEDLKVGVFAHQRLKAWVRFSSDAAPTDPDLKSTLGIAIKVFGVPGAKANGESGDTADLVLQNHPVFFLDDAREMCRFTYAGVVEGDYPGYLAKHPKTQAILDAMQKVEKSVLTATYWALLPFAAGAQEVVKYRLDPEATAQGDLDRSADYLVSDLTERLLRDDVDFSIVCRLFQRGCRGLVCDAASKSIETGAALMRRRPFFGIRPAGSGGLPRGPEKRS